MRVSIAHFSCALAWLSLPAIAAAAIEFKEVSAVAGITEGGTTYGASWGDFNNDGWPDIWVGNHDQPASLYVNNQDGTFTDVASMVWSEDPRSDYHGAAWADYDNDGDEDLLVTLDALYQGSALIPGKGHDHLLTNHQGRLQRLSAQQAPAKDRSSRMPVWLDFDNDGRLDFLIVARKGANSRSAIYRQTARHDFVEDVVAFKERRSSRTDHYKAFAYNLLDLNFVFPTDSFVTSHQESAQLTDLSGNGVLDLVFLSQPLRVYEFGDGALEEITYQLGIPPMTQLVDVVSGDFDGDGYNDLLTTRGRYRSSDVRVISDHQLSATLLGHEKNIAASQAKGLNFATVGPVTFDIHPEWLDRNKIRLGRSGTVPQQKRFTLDVDGIATGSIPLSSLEPGTFTITTDATHNRWQVRNSVIWEHADIIITSATPITEIEEVNFEPFGAAGNLQLLRRDGDVFVHDAAAINLNRPTSCFSLAGGDFDNDSDLDVYAVCTGPIGNLPNILLENDGSGLFKPVPGAAGASGSELGRGDVVATADYDQDGFLDLFITNGADPSSPFVNRGPHQLFRNQGNDNHWLALDLVGSASNPPAIGARVELVAGDKRQFRERNGGMHRFAQNHSRLHFGLGTSDIVDELIIYWPSGLKQRLSNVKADQILRIVEPKAG